MDNSAITTPKEVLTKNTTHIPTSEPTKPKTKKKKIFIITSIITATMLLIIAVVAAIFAIEGSKPIDWAEEVNLNDFWVTRRDIEVAKQMDAPEQVLQSMQMGQWYRPSDRDSVRYTEIAIKHMLDVHGQLSRATTTPSLPWMMQSYAKVYLAAVGGPHDGLEFTVQVSNKKDHSCTDNWYRFSHDEEIQEITLNLLKEALNDLPSSSWAAKITSKDLLKSDIPDNTPATEALAADIVGASIYIASSIIPNEEFLEELCTRAINKFKEQDYGIYIWIAVVPDNPDGSAIDLEYGNNQVMDNHELMTISDVFKHSE